MLIINCINISDIDDHCYQLFRSAVSEERRKRADRFHYMEDSKRSICAELLLKYSLYQTFGQSIDIDIGYNKYGKPFMKNIDGFLYNLSHSGKWVVIAYGNSEVGIDIEKIQIGKEEIVDKFFTEEEKSFIYGYDGKEMNQRFTQIWSLKESYIKYLGTGLSTSLRSFSVNVLDGVITNHEGVIQKGLSIKSLPFDKDYFLSVCTQEKEISMHEIVLEDMIQFIRHSM